MTRLLGDGELRGIAIETGGTEREIALDGLFVAIGLLPQNGIFENVIDLDAGGYADSGEDCGTRTEGIFVAGDCRRKAVRQVTTACSDGAAAAIAACRYCDK